MQLCTYICTLPSALQHDKQFPIIIYTTLGNLVTVQGCVAHDYQCVVQPHPFASPLFEYTFSNSLIIACIRQQPSGSYRNILITDNTFTQYGNTRTALSSEHMYSIYPLYPCLVLHDVRIFRFSLGSLTNKICSLSCHVFSYLWSSHILR